MNEIKLLVGLGNPEPDYELTRHNAGFWLLNLFTKHHRLVWKRDAKFKSEISNFKPNDSDNKKCWLMKPSLFMNQSGISISSFCLFYKIKPEHVLIVHDELDLLPGNLKLKHGGGNAGHNGLKNIEEKLGTNCFWRLRLGIGHPKTIETPIKNVSDFVLSMPSDEDRVRIDKGIDFCITHINDLLECNTKKIHNSVAKED